MYWYRLISALEMKSIGYRSNASTKPKFRLLLLSTVLLSLHRIAQIIFPTLSLVSISVNEPRRIVMILLCEAKRGQ